MPEQSLGLCQCGCGQRTNIARSSNANDNRVKGQPMRCVLGHYPGRPFKHATPCECGCGALATPGRRFITGHNMRRAEPMHLVDEMTGCWIWQRRKNDKGYGLIRVDGKVTRAHRWYYEQRVGSIPAGLYLDHECRNPSCVNPDHLRPATNAENQQNRDGIKGKGLRGAIPDRVRGGWIAQVKLNGRQRHLGRFPTEIAAASAASAFRAIHMPFSPDARGIGK